MIILTCMAEIKNRYFVIAYCLGIQPRWRRLKTINTQKITDIQMVWTQSDTTTCSGRLKQIEEGGREV